MLCGVVAVCYQLAQSVLKIARFCTNRKGWTGGRWVGAPFWVTVHGGCMLQLAVEKPWLVLGGHLSAFSHKRVEKMLLSPCI